MPAPRPLYLYRRHSDDCKVHTLHLNRKQTLAWMDCDCPIWAAGVTGTTVVPRQATGTRDLKVAEAIIAKLAAEGKDESVHGPRLADCIRKYLASRQDELAEKTYGQHALLLSRLQEFCTLRGVYFMAEISVDLLEDFKAEGLPNLAQTSKSTAVAKLRCFLEHAHRRRWTTESLATLIEPVRASYETAEPYTDEQVDLILAEALKLKGGTVSFAKYSETFQLLLRLMLETGLRVSDTIMYDPKKAIKGDKMWIYPYAPVKRKKTEKRRVVEAYLSNELKTAIDECKWYSHELPFRPSLKGIHYLANEVYERMKTIGDRCGIDDCRPHRLRDTFAVRMLLRGLDLHDVSRLLGHSSVKVTETHYAAWNLSRKRRLEGLVAESLVDSKSNRRRNRK